MLTNPSGRGRTHASSDSLLCLPRVGGGWGGRENSREGSEQEEEEEAGVMTAGVKGRKEGGRLNGLIAREGERRGRFPSE